MLRFSIRFLVILALLSACVHSSKVVSFSFILHTNGTVENTSISVVDGEVSPFQLRDGEYIVSVVDLGDQEIDRMGATPNFMLMSDPPKPVSKVKISGQLRHRLYADSLVIRHSGLEIYRQKIPAKFSCNHNGICDYWEDAIRCSDDCARDSGHVNLSSSSTNGNDNKRNTGGSDGPLLFIGFGLLAIVGLGLLALVIVVWFFFIRKKK